MFNVLFAIGAAIGTLNIAFGIGNDVFAGVGLACGLIGLVGNLAASE